MCKLCGAKAVALGRRRLWLSNLEPGGQGWPCQTRRWTSVSSTTSVKGKEKTNHHAKPVKDGGLTGPLLSDDTYSSTRWARLSHTLTSMSTVRRSDQQIKCSFNHFCPWNWFRWQRHTLLLTDQTQYMSRSWAHSESLSWRWRQVDLLSIKCICVQACTIEVQCSVCAHLSVHHLFLRFADTDSGNNIGENQGLNYMQANFSSGSVPVPCAYRLSLHQTFKKRLKKGQHTPSCWLKSSRWTQLLLHIKIPQSDCCDKPPLYSKKCLISRW